MEKLSAEERLAQGFLFTPRDPALKAVKLKTHNLNIDYNALYEDQTEERNGIKDSMMHKPEILGGYSV